MTKGSKRARLAAWLENHLGETFLMERWWPTTYLAALVLTILGASWLGWVSA